MTAEAPEAGVGDDQRKRHMIYDLIFLINWQRRADVLKNLTNVARINQSSHQRPPLTFFLATKRRTTANVGKTNMGPAAA